MGITDLSVRYLTSIDWGLRSLYNMRNKSASFIGNSDRPKSTMNTRAKDSGNRGLEEVGGTSSAEHKKKNLNGGGASRLMSEDDNARPGEGGLMDGDNAYNLPNNSNFSPQPPHAYGDDEDNRPVNKSTLNNHVALLMDKLNSIEGSFTATLNKEVSSIFTKLDEQSGRIKGTENLVASHTQQISELKKKNLDLTQQLGELKKRQSSIVQEVNSNVREQMKSFKDSLRKDNVLFRAELINTNNKKIECTAKAIREDVREDFMEEKSHSRKNNLIIMGLQEPGEGDSDLTLVKSLFVER